MKREDFLSKLNIKDYNNQLEDILEKKSFSEGTKNILLNILYKMETAYEDYNKVKVDTKTKKDMLEEIIETIEKYCKEIELIKPKLNEETKLGDKKFIIDKNKIISYPNEKTVFYALCYIQPKKFRIKTQYNILKEPMEKLLNSGYIEEKKEIIRDFDGWAWNISKDDINRFIYNLIYQNIKILLGNNFIQECISNMNNIDFIDKFEKKMSSLYREEIAIKIEEQIYIISIIENIKNNKKAKKELLEEKKTIEEELNKISNKKAYLQEIANKKKIIAKKIRKIDETVNDNNVLRESFIEKNKTLKENEKIFSLSEYTEILQQNRGNLLNELKRYSNLMKPMIYVKNKSNLQKKSKLLNKIDFNLNIEEQEKNAVEELQLNFLKAIQEKIGKVETKKKILEVIYMFRYYKLLYVNEEKQIKDIDKTREQLEMAEKYLIIKACNLKAINILSSNIEKNCKLISSILDCNIIDLDEMNLEIKKKENNVVINIFDDNMIDKSIEYKEKLDINLKNNKRMKLFN